MLAGALAITAIVTAMAPPAWGILHAHSEVPVELSQFAVLPNRSILLDINGQQVGVYEIGDKRQQVPISQVPEVVKNAFIAVEDAGFFLHKGVNIRAIGRAILSNARPSGKSGASTISQQVLKNENQAFGGLGGNQTGKIENARPWVAP